MNIVDDLRNLSDEDFDKVLQEINRERTLRHEQSQRVREASLAQKLAEIDEWVTVGFTTDSCVYHYNSTRIMVDRINKHIPGPVYASTRAKIVSNRISRCLGDKVKELMETHIKKVKFKLEVHIPSGRIRNVQVT